MKTKTKVKAKVKRTRRASVNRAPKTMYAISSDGKTLHQFQTVAAFKRVAGNEGLSRIPSLEFREKLAQNYAYQDRRASVVPAAQAAPHVIERASAGVSQEMLSLAVIAALGALQAHAGGNLPRVVPFESAQAAH